MSAWIATLFSSSMDGSYARLSAASWAVVIGVAIEETPLFLKTASFIRGKFKFLAWNTGGIVWLREQEKTFEAIGFILLVLGLVLEIRFQGAAESAEKDMRVASEIVVQGLRVRATDAEGRIATLQNSTASAQADAARATADAARANERAAKIEAAAATRVVGTPKDWQLAAISVAHPVGISIVSYAFDAEGAHLANQIIAVLRELNFVVADSSLTAGAQKPLAFGVYVSGSDKVLVNALIVWLNAYRLSAVESVPAPSAFSIGGETLNHPPEATIFVGSKPLTN